MSLFVHFFELFVSNYLKISLIFTFCGIKFVNMFSRRLPSVRRISSSFFDDEIS